MTANFLKLLYRPVDNSPIIIFRMFFGLLICLEAWGAIATGWVYRAFIEPEHNFPFIIFSWLEPLPGNGMYIYYVVMGVAGLMVMLGYRYKWGIGLYTVMWAGVYFMQKTHYNNHYYLLLLLCCLMWLIPANAYASSDVRSGRVKKNLTCPQWCIWIFVVQITIVYIYASVAKMYPDWLAAEPIKIWFKSKSHYFLIGSLLQKEWVQYAVAYGGVAFDLLIAPALIWKKTRKYAFFASIFFHLFNSAVFQVGIFPYMGIAWAVFFFEPETIRKLFFKKKPPIINSSTCLSNGFEPSTGLYSYSRFAIYFLAVYFLFQLALPLRQHFYPSNVVWTEEGHRMSWRMMLRVKWGTVSFNVIDNETGEETRVHPYKYLSGKQARVIATRPDMCWQFVQIIKEEFASQGKSDISIYANSSVRLNGRPAAPLYNPKADLAQVEWKPFAHSAWLMPMQESL